VHLERANVVVVLVVIGYKIVGSVCGGVAFAI
jgi:hypothetical protein